jgi:iron(III) transport system ATP-binding protein
VALARTVVIEPQVLLLDEPLSNLDKNLRVQMRQELLSLQRQLGITTIFVTHDQEEAMTTADRMAVLDAGVLQQVGTPAELFDNPANAFVAGFVGTANLLPGRVCGRDGDAVAVSLDGIGSIRLPASAGLPEAGTVTLTFRPHATHIDAAGHADDGGVAWLDGVIAGSEFLGEFVRYQVRIGQVMVTADQPHLRGATARASGTAVRLGIEASQVRCLPA